MRLILMGAPGAGKGTQAAMLAEKLNIPHISTGDIFRSNIKKGTDLGRKAKEYIDRGALVPDEVTAGIVRDRLEQPDCASGFILDGFPRTIPQAEYLDRVLKEMGTEVDFVIDIYVSDKEIIKRLTGRRICQACGTTFHMLYSPPQNEGKCDNCGGRLIRRADDDEETVSKRLETYHRQTEPLIEHYERKGKLIRVNGEGSIGDTSRELLKVLGAE